MINGEFMAEKGAVLRYFTFNPFSPRNKREANSDIPVA
jgi:hypothetical protein